jgi:alkylation response protein AidB-like acyl-CoA dehydrogenase
MSTYLAGNTAWPLSIPVTPEGRRLLELIAEQLPEIAASAADHDRDGTFPHATFERFRDSGVMGATVPAGLGGLGVDRLYDIAAALLAVATADASTALALHMQFSRGLTLTYEWQHAEPGAQVLAEGLLREMGAGKAAVCGAAKDHPSTTTTLVPDGTGDWILTGRKTLVSMAPIGTHFVAHASARTGARTPRLAAPIVPRDTPGVTVLDNWQGLGMRASGTVDVIFDQCPVPDRNVFIRDPVGARNDAVLAGQTVSSITMLGIYLGIAQAARDATVDTLRGRSDEPPAGARTLISHVDANLYTLHATTAAALTNADTYSADLSGDMDERGRRMMLPYQYAKLAINELAPAIVNDCLTVTGSRAYATTHHLSRLYRDVRAGTFMQPYTYSDAVNFLSAQTLGLDQDNNYMSVRAAKSAQTT